MEIVPVQDKSCETCKYQSKYNTDEPCAHCTKNATDNYEPMTNGDYVRMLSDTEMAKILMCPKQFDEDYETGCEQNNPKCIQCTLRWLEQERREEE